MTLPNSFSWAVWAAEGLDYLEKLDAGHPGDVPVPPTGFHPDLVDISHVRWATANAITAIDLCAATMGRLFCGSTGQWELSLRDFDPKSNRRKRDRARCRTLSGVMKWVCRQPARNSPPDAKSLRASLPPKFLDWVKDTLADARYRELHRARNPFTHAWLRRHLSSGGAGHAGRTQFEVLGTGQRVNARDVVVDSASLALDRVRAFIDVVDQY